MTTLRIGTSIVRDKMPGYPALENIFQSGTTAKPTTITKTSSSGKPIERTTKSSFLSHKAITSASTLHGCVKYKTPKLAHLGAFWRGACAEGFVACEVVQVTRSEQASRRRVLGGCVQIGVESG